MIKIGGLLCTAAFLGFVACGGIDSDSSHVDSLKANNFSLGVLKLKNKDGTVRGFTVVACPNPSLGTSRANLLKTCIPAFKNTNDHVAMWKSGTEKRWDERIDHAESIYRRNGERIGTKVFAGFASAPVYFFSESILKNGLLYDRRFSRLRGKAGGTIAAVVGLTLAIGAYELISKSANVVVGAYSEVPISARRNTSHELGMLQTDIKGLLLDSDKPLEEQLASGNEQMIKAQSIPLLLEEISSYYTTVKVNTQVYGL